ncbi:hypothetical protein [Rhizobium mesosinicum]|uniref:WGR domain-containing protein n=1 Tax=Rhizobium mesosinicum TaxID=335017 RepID=A0ABS7GZS3_9HYPH|nr:hypothetical protein [Rhizobium mesosinicum]MBW9054865.1 hypothetical protein [Rhizobium mesosinicum]
MQVVKELEIVEIPDAIHPRRRMVLIQREDGFYAYAEQYYYISRYGGEIIAEGWARLPTDGSIYENPQAAEAEARREFSGRHGVAY